MAIYSIYHKDYLAGYMSISNIPYAYWDEDIVKRALSVEPYIYYEELLEHSHNGLTGVSVVKCVNKTPEKYRSLDFYKRLLKLDEVKYRDLVPPKILRHNVDAAKNETEKLIEKFELTPKPVRTPQMYQQLSKLSFDDYLLYVVDYKGIPEIYRTKENCLPLFYGNLDYYVAKIPDILKTTELAKMLLARDFQKWFFILPSHCKTTWMYEQFVQINPFVNLPQVPIEQRTQKMYDIFFEYTLDTHLDMIPKKFLTDAMWKKLIMLDDKKYFYDAPEECFDYELIVYLAKKNSYYLDVIPFDSISKDVFLELIRYDARKFLNYLPEKYYTSDVIKEISSIIDKKVDLSMWGFNINSRLNRLIIDYNPPLIKRFTESVFRDIIKMELLYMTSEGTSIEDIAQKYRVSADSILKAFNTLSITDKKAFAKISSYLSGENSPLLDDQMGTELSKLEKIIQAIGPAKRHTITTEQKVQFAYLTNRYLHVPLEKIFNYNNSSLNQEVSEIVNHFFENVLDHAVKYDQYNGAFDIRKITTNNEWYKKFSVSDFFKIKNGNQNIWYYYQNHDNEMTPDMANEIIARLQLEEIPLNYLIVAVAFRKYFLGELDNYINELHSYDMVLKKTKRKKR